MSRVFWIFCCTLLPTIRFCSILQSDTFNYLGYTRLFTAVFRNIADTTLVNSFLRSHFLLCLFEFLSLLHAWVTDGLGTTGCETFVLKNCARDRAWARRILRL